VRERYSVNRSGPLACVFRRAPPVPGGGALVARSLLARLGVRRSDHASIARDFSVYSSVNIVSLVLLLGTALMLRRYLGPLFAGIWITLDVLPNYAQYAHLGILNSAERDLPFLLGARRLGEFDRRKHTLFWLTHGIGALLTIGLVAGALAFRSRLSSQPLFVGLLAYAPLLWLQILSAYYVVLYRARRRFVALSARQGMANLTKAVLTMAAGYAFGLYGVFAALLSAAVVQVVLLHGGLGDERFERVFDPDVLWPMLVAGLPMLVGAVAFETIRNADRLVIVAALGLRTQGVYSVVPIICQGLFYVPNTLFLVMYPRFQARYGETQSVESLRRFVELPLHVLADGLLAAIVVLIVALPPALTAYLPDYAASIAPLRVMLIGTYFLCLSPPAGQLLLTIHKQISVLGIAVPSMVLALGAAYLGASQGLVGVAAGVALGCFVQFVGVNLYALSQLGSSTQAVRPIVEIAAKAAVALALIWVIERVVPPGPAPIAIVGGWRLCAAIAVALPLLVRAAIRLREASSSPLPDASARAVVVDNPTADH
jgi:O-antigen/teichoic acid export membrane protein